MENPFKFGTIVEAEYFTDRILDYTGCHPYYSQQLAANVWQTGVLHPETEDVLQDAINHIVITHALDYERIWMGFKRTNRWILHMLSTPINMNLKTRSIGSGSWNN